MKIEAITTCVGDNARRMLDFTASKNKLYFDNFIVVTTPEDTKTQNICNEHGLSCVVTDSFKKYGFKFNKGAAINEGIRHSRYKEYIYHIDGDILIGHKNYRYILEKELDDIEYFYGSRRVIVENFDQLIALMDGKRKEDSFVSYPGVGYGFSQIWHQQSKIVNGGAIYPETCEKGESDWRWRNLWGDLKNKDTEIIGNLKALSVNVWHLGLPDIAGADSFWNKEFV